MTAPSCCLGGILVRHIQRAMAKFPPQGVKKPWKAYQTYALDLMALKLERRRVDAPA